MSNYYSSTTQSSQKIFLVAFPRADQLQVPAPQRIGVLRLQRQVLRLTGRTEVSCGWLVDSSTLSPSNGIVLTHRSGVDVSKPTLSLLDTLKKQRQECSTVRIFNHAGFEAGLSIALGRVRRQLPLEYGKLNFAHPRYARARVDLESTCSKHIPNSVVLEAVHGE